MPDPDIGLHQPGRYAAVVYKPIHNSWVYLRARSRPFEPVGFYGRSHFLALQSQIRGVLNIVGQGFGQICRVDGVSFVAVKRDPDARVTRAQRQPWR